MSSVSCQGMPSSSRAAGPWQSVRVTTNHFDEPIAARYDDDPSEQFDPEVIEATVDFLADLALGAGTGTGTGAGSGSGGGPGTEPRALELGIGTGRIALPLSRRGVRMHGIDLSAAMVER